MASVARFVHETEALPEFHPKFTGISPEVHRNSSSFRQNIELEHLKTGDSHNSAFPHLSTLEIPRCLYLYIYIYIYTFLYTPTNNTYIPIYTYIPVSFLKVSYIPPGNSLAAGRPPSGGSGTRRRRLLFDLF